MKDKIKTKTYYWLNRNKMSEFQFVNDKTHGFAIGWNENGGNRWEGSYKNNLQHGSKIEFNY